MLSPNSLLAWTVWTLALLMFSPKSTFATEVNVTVSKSPKIVDFVDRLNHPEGTNATFTCSIGSGELNGLTFEWFKDDRKISPSNKLKISVAPENFQSALRVIDLKSEDSSVYSCVARNRFGQDKISTKLVVKVQLKWLIEPPPEVEVHAGKPIHIPCSASGQPEPRIEWIKLEDARNLGRELNLETANPNTDVGLYECRAKNGIEEDLVARTKVIVLGK